MTETLKKENPLGYEPVGKLLRKFAIPSCIALVVNALYNIVDQIFIGQSVGYLGNGATNIILPFTVLAMAISLLCGDGCAAFYSQMLGRKKPEEAAKGVFSAIIVSIVACLALMAVFLIFAEPLCKLTGGTSEFMPYALDYGRIIAIGYPMTGFACAFSAVIRADGSPRYSMSGLIAGCITNIILDYIFVFPLDMGVKGAALATVLGQIANVLVYVFYFKRFKCVTIKKENVRVSPSALKPILKLGSSSFITQMSAVVIIIVLNNIMVKYGAQSVYGAEIPLTSFGITMKINNILVSIMAGIGAGSLPIIGFNYGAGNYERIKKTIFTAISAASICGLIATVFFQIFPAQIVNIFGAQNDLYLNFGILCLRIFLSCIILDGLNNSAATYFQAMGKPVYSVTSSICRQIAFNIPVLLILSAVMGIEGCLWAGPVTTIASFILNVTLLVKGLKSLKAELHYSPIKAN